MHDNTKVTTESGQEFCTNLYSEEEERTIKKLLSPLEINGYLVTISVHLREEVISEICIYCSKGQKAHDFAP